MPEYMEFYRNKYEDFVVVPCKVKGKYGRYVEVEIKLSIGMKHTGNIAHVNVFETEKESYQHFAEVLIEKVEVLRKKAKELKKLMAEKFV